MSTDMQTAARALMEAAERARRDELVSIEEQRIVCRAIVQGYDEARERLALLDAEYARVEAQKSKDLARQALDAAQEQPKPEPYRAGLPPERLRKVWAEWEDQRGDIVRFNRVDVFEWMTLGGHPNREPTQFSTKEVSGAGMSFRPHGATWARVEAMADEAERARATPQPAGKRAVVMVGDLPYYADSVSFDSAGKLIKGEGVPFGLPPVPQKPADPPAPTLLDLTKLPPGTVCEALEDIPRWNGRTVAAGVWFTLRDQSIVEGDEFPIVVTTNGENTYCIPALVPARVVKEGGEQ